MRLGASKGNGLDSKWAVRSMVSLSSGIGSDLRFGAASFSRCNEAAH